jgi:deferrochelatase/peroxidase EfeB
MDAMLLLADDDPDYLMRQGRCAIDVIRQHSSVVAVERGRAIRNQNGETIEPFGYVDGRSQPLYLAPDFRKDDAGRTCDDRRQPFTVWNPFEPLKRILVSDRAGENCFGSFLVFRKLEQNVREFVRAERELAYKLFGSRSAEDQDRAGALVVGRFRHTSGK